MAASLFAGRPVHHSNADIWHYIAQAWEELAGLKERANSWSSPEAKLVLFAMAPCEIGQRPQHGDSNDREKDLVVQ